MRDGWGAENLDRAESAAQAWISFALARLSLAGFVTALPEETILSGSRRGAVSLLATFSFQSCPAFPAYRPVKCPLYAKAIDIFGCALAQQLLLLASRLKP